MKVPIVVDQRMAHFFNVQSDLKGNYLETEKAWLSTTLQRHGS